MRLAFDYNVKLANRENMAKKIKRFPYSKESTQRLNTQKRIVPCQVSSRWLQFPEESSVQVDGDYISIQVMTSTTDANGNEKEMKICGLIIYRESLEAVLAACKVKN